MGERVIKATRWTAAFRPSSAVSGMFVVQPEYWGGLREAIDDLSVPSSGWGGMYSSFGSTWAFLDGGVHYIDSYGYGMTTLHTGWRVLGWQVMRVLCELFDLAPPRRLKGEAELGEPADLIRQLRATSPGDAVLQERAELLASASTGRRCVRSPHGFSEATRIQCPKVQSGDPGSSRFDGRPGVGVSGTSPTSTSSFGSSWTATGTRS